MLKSTVLRNHIEAEHSEFHLKTYDGINLFLQRWIPFNVPRALIILVHSFGEHSTRYQRWAEQLASKDFAVLGYDIRNHGKSEGKGKCISSYADLLKDLTLIIEKGRKLFPSTPVFLYGQGFGGNLALNYTIAGSPAIQGLIVTAPWLDPIKRLPAYKSIFISPLMRLAPGILIRTGLKAEDISRDLRIVHLFRNDPMVFDKIGIKLFCQANEAAAKVLRSIYKINVPLLLIHGNADNVASCETSRSFVQNASERTSFIELDGGYHEPHNDNDKEKIFDVLTKWLNLHC
jgi:acylglycerol lipase